MGSLTGGKPLSLKFSVECVLPAFVSRTHFHTSSLTTYTRLVCESFTENIGAPKEAASLRPLHNHKVKETFSKRRWDQSQATLAFWESHCFLVPWHETAVATAAWQEKSGPVDPTE